MGLKKFLGIAINHLFNLISFLFERKTKLSFSQKIYIINNSFETINMKKEISGLIDFIFDWKIKMSLLKKISFINKLFEITYSVKGYHNQFEVLPVIKKILLTPKEIKGCVVEAGAYNGCSTAKFSIAAEMTGRKLVVFDSFKGLPENQFEKTDKYYYGIKLSFSKGNYSGSLNKVKNNIKKFGKINACSFRQGWFNETMPEFSEPVIAVFLDVDLASSTKTCLKYLYPLLVPGGIIVSQDGHIPSVRKVFEDKKFWEKEVGCKKPVIHGKKSETLIKIIKPEK